MAKYVTYNYSLAPTEEEREELKKAYRNGLKVGEKVLTQGEYEVLHNSHDDGIITKVHTHDDKRFVNGFFPNLCGKCEVTFRLIAECDENGFLLPMK